MNALTSLRCWLAAAVLATSVFGDDRPWGTRPVVHECAALIAGAVPNRDAQHFRTAQDLTESGVLDIFPDEIRAEVASVLLGQGRPQPADMLFVTGDATEMVYRAGRARAASMWARQKLDERRGAFVDNTSVLVRETQQKLRNRLTFGMIATLATGGFWFHRINAEHFHGSPPTLVAGGLAAFGVAYIFYQMQNLARRKERLERPFTAPGAERTYRTRAARDEMLLTKGYSHRDFFAPENGPNEDFTVDLVRPLAGGWKERYYAAFYTPPEYLGPPQLLLIRWGAH